MIRLVGASPNADLELTPVRSSEREQASVLRYRPVRSVAAGHYRFEIEYPPEGLIEHLVELRYREGLRAFRRLGVARRNHFDGGIEILPGLSELLLHVSGSGRIATPPRVALNPWDRHEAPWIRQARRLLRAVRSAPLSTARRLLPMARRASRRAVGRRPAEAQAWAERFDERPERDLALHRERLGRLRTRPLFTLLIDGTAEETAAVLTDLAAQIYPEWRALVWHPDDARRSGPRDPRIRVMDGTAAETVSGDYLVPLAGSVRLRPHTLLEFAVAAELCPQARLIYADHAVAHAGGLTPVCKPAWSPERFAEDDYLGRTVVCSAKWSEGLLRDRKTFARPSTREIANLDASIVHVPRVLTHEPPSRRTSAPPVRAEMRPRVSIVIATRDRAALLRACVESVFERTRYPDYEIVIVDNGSADPEACALLRELSRRPGVTVACAPGPFNYSALNNAGAAIAAGEVLVLLNNDVEVITPEWLEELATLAAARGVGCAGALLLYPDRTIQHAGLALGIEEGATHVLRGRRPDDPALGALLGVRRNVVAVTGACLALRKTLFESAGGLDAASLPVSYNDVDLCLKAIKLGFRNVWTPHARLIHHESASRGADDAPEKIALARRELDTMYQRWGVRMMRDPYHPPAAFWASPLDSP